jgi:hypothetical protein
MNQTPIDDKSESKSAAAASSAGNRFHAIHYANQLEPVHGFLGRYMRRRLASMDTDQSCSSSSDLVRIVDWLPKVWHKVNKYLDILSPSTDITIGNQAYSLQTTVFAFEASYDFFSVSHSVASWPRIMRDTEASMSPES